MNNKEILKNILVTVGLLTTSIVALVYFNTKLTDNSSKQAITIAPAATIHQYVPTSSYAVTNTGADSEDMVANSASVAPNSHAAVKEASYPNNLVIHASTGTNTTVVGSNANTNASVAPKSNIVQQRQQMQMGALTAVNSRRLVSETTKTSQVGEPFQEIPDAPGTISRKDLPEEPEEPFPDEDAPIGGGMSVLLALSFVYGIRKRLNK